MALFSWKALTQEGKKSKGTIEAFSLHEAKEKLRQLNLIIVEITEVQKKETRISSLTQDNLVVFTSQLSQLIAAKIPLYEGLLALEEQARGEHFHGLILGVAERIKKGASLSRALQDFPDCFSPLYIALVQAGEAVGNLELALGRLSTLLTYQHKMGRQLMGALTYPLLLIGLMSIVLGVLVGFVIPSIEPLFEGRPLPAFTACVFGTAHFLRTFWPVLLIAIVVAAFVFFRQFRNKEARANMQRLFLKVPILNRYILHSSLARFAKTLATLLDGGLPLPNALAFAQEALHNMRLEEIIKRMSELVIEGKTISSGLSGYKEIPTLFIRMVKIGEETGKLSAMLNQVATIYEDDTERTLSRFISLIQPALLVLMGIVIGTVILSILLPLSSFSSTLQF